MKQIEMTSESWDALKKVVEWYDAMPAFLEIGDTAHERILGEIDNLLPEIEEIENLDYYSGGVEVVDGKLLLTLVSEYDYEDDSVVELVAV